MDREEYAEQRVRKLLWGYPDLVVKFCEELRPALEEAREKIKKEREEAEQQKKTTEQVSNVPEVDAEDKNDNAPVPSQSSENAPITGGSGLQLDSQVHPDDHPLTSYEHRLLIATSGTMEAL